MRRVGFVVLAACGRIGFAPVTDDAMDGDATDALGTWSAIDPVSELSSPGIDDDPSLTGDMLELYYNSTRSGNSDIWVAKRASIALPFDPPVAVTELSSPGDDTTPELSSDGLTLYFASDRAGGLGNNDRYVAKRATRMDIWSAAMHVIELSSTVSDESAYVDAAGTTVYFDSERAHGTEDTIFIATRLTESSPWSVPTVVVELDGAAEEENPFVDATELTMWLTEYTVSARYDLSVTTRVTPTSRFAAIRRLDELNTSSSELDPWVSADQRVMYFSSNRGGDFEIYRATR
jgi:hypothetical protein